MRLDKHGDVISSSCGRYTVVIALMEKATAAKLSIARRQTTERMAAGKPIDVTEARAKGLIR